MIHPLFAALLEDWCSRCSPPLDPSEVIGWIQGTREIPRAVADAMQRALDIPVSSWGKLGGDLSIAGLQRKRRPVSAPRVGGSGRRPINPQHPIYAYLAKRGQTMRDWAESSNRAPSTVAAWASGRNPIPAEEAIAIETETDGAVPATCWRSTYST